MNYEKEDFDSFSLLFSKYPLSPGITGNSDLLIIADFINAMIKFYCNKLNITADIYFKVDTRDCYVGSGTSRYHVIPKYPSLAAKLMVNNKSILVF